MEKDITTEQLRDIFSDVLQIFCREHEILAGELARMKVIVDEASSNLQESFNGMTNENKLLKQKLDSLIDEDMQKMDLMGLSNENMNRYLNLGIRTLQFDDIIQQMINHANRRISTLMELLEFVKLQSKEEFTNPADQKAIQDMLENCKKYIQDTKKKLELDNPVNQSSLNSGDIELF